MSFDQAIQRAQVYYFLAGAFLYPNENWTEDVPLLKKLLASSVFSDVQVDIPAVELSDLQNTFRRTFGLSGSLCYETEYGLPHEYRHSQELADISGFYRAFGFSNLNGNVRERPDHIAVELEFMYILAHKEAYGIQKNITEQVEVCVDAQRKFLQSHLGQWIGLFAQALKHNVLDTTNNVFYTLGYFATEFISSDCKRLSVNIEQRDIAQMKHTPFNPSLSCTDDDCLTGPKDGQYIDLASIT